MLTAKRTAIAALAAATASLAAVSPALAKTHQVHKGQSIQAAIDAAKPGDTIHVHKGTYKEYLTINKNGIKLIGTLARLVPAATAPTSSPCAAFTESGKAPGICVIGDATPNASGPPIVNSTVNGVRISGFVVKGFPADGVFNFAAKGTRADHDAYLDNGGYGIFANTSSHTRLEESNSQAGLTCDAPFTRLMRAGNQSKQRRLAASIPPEDSPAIALPNSECYCFEDLCRAEFDTSPRDRYLSQERNTLEQAARQPSSDSTV